VLLSAKRKNGTLERKDATAPTAAQEHHPPVTSQETSVDQIYRRSCTALTALFSAVALTACGGGGSSTPTPAASAPPSTPVPSPPAGPSSSDAAFATPSSATDTGEAGKIETYSFAEKGNELVAGAATYTTGEVGFSATLSGSQAYAGAAIRLYAPGNTGAAPVTAFNAAGFTKLKIQLKSSSDGLLSIKLQPSPVAGDGCTATAQAIVNSSLSELVIDLNDTMFPLPDYCNGIGSKVGTLKAGLFAVDVINSATGTGSHNLSVGTVKLAP
jgi:hypothetical protein